MIMESANNKMKVEIWSDITCPFCYIGKRKFETAVSGFKDASNIEVIWKSFELVPNLKSEPGKNIYHFLSEHTGMSLEAAKNAGDQLANTAEQAGLIYDFDKVIPAKSFNAHRFSHLAKSHGLQNEAEEKLFKAYFTEGKNIDDISTLVQLGVEMGLDTEETKNILESNQYADEVRDDIHDAQQVGARGVPFFVLNRKHTIQGAQGSPTFLQILEDAYAEWMKDNPQIFPKVTEGEFCELNRVCK